MKSQLRIALPVTAAAVGILLAGCSRTGTAAQSSGTPASASSTPAAASSSTPAAASSTPASPTATPSADSAALPQCSAADLTIAYTDNSQINNGALAGMSHQDSVVIFTNKSSASCQTAGYPGVAVLDVAGRQIKQAVRVAGSAPVIVLRPGQVASALISANSASCVKETRAAGLLVTAPNQRASTRLGADGEFCLNSIQIGTLQRGNAAGLKLG
jgi:membrane-bound inhibitor of C-type lysozyme